LLSTIAVLTLALALAACGEDDPGVAEADGDEVGDDVEEAEELDYPTQQLDWTVAFGPGGGNDILSRLLADLLQEYELWTEDIVVTNREGGSGATGWSYLYSNAGDPYQVSTTSGSFITTPLQADLEWDAHSFTPVALLGTDDVVFYVSANSPWETFEDFVEGAQESTPTVGGMGTAQVEFIAPSQVAAQAGFDIDYVAFDDQGELISAVLSDSLDIATSNPGALMGHIESGDLRPLAFSGPDRLPGLDDTPTIDELGYEVTVSMPRGLILAPDVDEAVQQWWIEAIQELVETPEWQDYLRDNLVTENVLYGNDFAQYLEDVVGDFEEELRAEGVID
jgi:putative tricarboxylic transport membrane protein